MNSGNPIGIWINIIRIVRKHRTHWEHSQTKNDDTQWIDHLIQNQMENINFIAVAVMGESKVYAVITLEI